MLLHLGKYGKYKLYYPTSTLTNKQTDKNQYFRKELKKGEIIKCYLYKCYINPITYMILPINVTNEDIPLSLSKLLSISKNIHKST